MAGHAIIKNSFLLACVVAAGALYAQTTAPNLTFAYQTLNPSTTPVTIAAGGQITFPSTSVGASSTANLIITNAGTTAVTISGVTVTGSAFSTLSSGSVVVQANSAAAVSVQFTPLASGAASGILTLQTASSTTSYMFVLAGTGVAPQFVTSYQLQTNGQNGNQIAIASGGTIPFAAINTATNSSETATFTISNTGNGPGTVSSVTISGTAFTTSGLPVLPATIAAGGAIQFTITFAPTALGAQTGSLTIQLGSAQETINLTGTATGPVFTYAYGTNAQNGTPLAANGTINFADTTVGGNTTLVVTVTNTGSAPGTVSAVTAVGTSAFIVGSLVSLPTQLAPGAVLSFTLEFAPTVVGPISAKLEINSTLFNVTGTGLGPVLTVSVTIASATTQIGNGGVAFFPNTTVGSKQQATVTVMNTGNVATTISTIGVTGAAFSLAAQPSLPTNLAPGSTLPFTVVFSPNAIGTLTGVLGINSLVINLQGTGTAPAALPTYSFTGASGTATPLQQPTVGLQLSTGYPLAISGTLTLTFASAEFTDDPSIQFSSGGRTVNFTIPANTTTALFGTAQQIQFQAGTVAGTITLTPSFSIGTLNLTPSSPTVLAIQIPPGPPQIRNVQIGASSSTSFQILVTGYSTTRSVSTIALTFTPTPGGTLQTTSLSISSDSAFSAWYQNTASAAVGSQFTATLTINVSGPITAVQSVGVVATNAQGSSSMVSANTP